MALLKKAQIETMGLVIIVVIIAFAFIFALQFINKDDNKLNERHLQLNADNLRSTILKTNINTCNIKDEIISCNNFNTPICLENCEELNLIIKEIIEKSIENNYEFAAGKIKLNNKNCFNKDVITSSIQPIALTDIKVSLKLC